MSKRKKKSNTPSPKKKKTKKNDKKAKLKALLAEHSELSREEALEIIEKELTFEEWKAQKEEEKRERQRQKQEKMLKLLLAQYKELQEEEAKFIIENNLDPQEYLKEKKAELRRQKKKKSKNKWTKKSSPSSTSFLKKRKIEELLKKYPELTRAVAGQIVANQLTLSQFRKKKQKKKLQSSRTPEEHKKAQELRKQRELELQKRIEEANKVPPQGDLFLQEEMEKQHSWTALRFYAPKFSGQIIKIQPLKIYLRTKHDSSLPLRKITCVLLHRTEEEEALYEHIKVNPQQEALKEFPYYEPSERYTVPEEWLEEGAPLTLDLHNGLRLQGSVIWADPFQILLKLADQHDVFVFRHSIKQAYNSLLTDEEESSQWPTLQAFLKMPPNPPQYPKELDIEKIKIPRHFFDYPVKDQRFHKIQELYEQGKFTINPIAVKREGEQYVLVNGFRRLTLAKEKNIPKVPIILTY